MGATLGQLGGYLRAPTPFLGAPCLRHALIKPRQLTPLKKVCPYRLRLDTTAHIRNFDHAAAVD